MTVNMSEAQRRRSYYSRNESSVHELSVYGLGGLSSLNYKLSGEGTKSNGIGGGAGLGYTFNINESWGIVTGAEVGMYASKVAYDNLSGEYEYGIAGDENHFIFHYSMNDYKEQQKAILLSVPVMAQFKIPVGGSAHFYLSGGFKLGLPVSAEATINPGRVTTSGEFSYEQVEYGKDAEEYGFVNNMPFAETKSKIDLGFSAALALETGVRFSLNDNIALYAGAFLDYGLNDIRSAKDKHIIDYQITTSSVFANNSVLNSSLTDKANIFSAGLKIRISFGL
jgi:hypothetical protein